MNLRFIVPVAALGLCACHDDCKPVLLTVAEPAGAMVSVTSANTRRDLRSIGTVPFTKISGACVGDVVEVVKDDRRYKESIVAGEPNEEKVIKVVSLQ